MYVTSETRFAIIPEWILDAEISSNAVRLYGVLARYADQDGHAHPSRTTLAERLRVSVDTIDRCIKELTGIGAVEIRARYDAAGDRAPNGYHLHVSPPQPAADVPEGGRTDTATGSRTDTATGGRTGTAQTKAIGTKAKGTKAKSSSAGNAAAADSHVELATRTPAEVKAAGLIRAVKGASHLSADTVIAHLRDIFAARGQAPDDETLIAEALRFRDFWQTRRANQPDAPWRAWRTALTNWFTRTPLPGAAPKAAPASHVASSLSALRRLGDMYRTMEDA